MKTERGFSLIEIMVVIAIAAIAMTFAVPNIVGWKTKQRFLSAASDVHEAVKAGRSWAIKENTTVQIQFDTGNRRFTAFPDYNGNLSQDAGERTIFSSSYLNDIVLTTGGLVGNRLTIDSRGLVNSPGTGIGLQHAEHGRRIIAITVTGNSRVTVP